MTFPDPNLALSVLECVNFVGELSGADEDAKSKHNSAEMF